MQTSSPSIFKQFYDLVRFEHTLFALPFAYGGMLLAARGWPGIAVFIWVTLAMVGARTAAMALNRLIDREIDRKNPRTQERALAKGTLEPGPVWGLALGSLALLGVSAVMLNPLATVLFPVAVIFLVLYSYTKRFTWLCHLVLGVTNGAAAAGGWIAVTGYFEPATFALWGAVALWIGGFDVLYALQDYAFDRQERLHSIPARFGIAKALTIARASHGLAWALFVLTGVLYGAGIWYFLGVAFIGAVLVYEHSLVKPDDLSRVEQAFFQANVAVSLSMLLFVGLEVWL